MAEFFIKSLYRRYDHEAHTPSPYHDGNYCEQGVRSVR